MNGGKLLPNKRSPQNNIVFPLDSEVNPVLLIRAISGHTSNNKYDGLSSPYHPLEFCQLFSEHAVYGYFFAFIKENSVGFRLLL